jgi:hypothetical protein
MSSIFPRIFSALQGRHTAFITANLIIGTVLAWFHRLDHELVVLLLGLQTCVLAHAGQENYFEVKKVQ